MIPEKLRMQLAEYGQEHVLRFYDTLSGKQREALTAQLEAIDFPLLNTLYRQAVRLEAESEAKIEPISSVVEAQLSREDRQGYYQRGMALLRRGRYAAVTMAGGQGTRLGHDGPKGTFALELPERVSLFEIQCRRLLARSQECGVTIPWYIMTSVENDAATKDFFQEHDYFGYPPQDIQFFTQFMLPMLDLNGKLILEEPYKIKEGADGHGGIFRAMLRRGVLEDMKRRGVEWIFTGGIDNVLVRLEDPCFLGFLAENGYELGGKSVYKRNAQEKAGVFCKKDGHPFVMEYTEIPPEYAELKNGAGDYVYGDAHILCNLFHRSVFEKMGSEGLPYHTARKKAAYLNERGEKATPAEPNAYKFEAFIFDAFAFYQDMGILRIEREHEFAPVKNQTGEDSPETARKLYLADAESQKGACSYE